MKSKISQLRSTNDDLTIYQPYQSPLEGSSDTVLRFLKTSSSLPRPAAEPIYDEQHNRIQPLRAIQDLDNYSTVFMPGDSPSFIFKSASSLPQFINLRTGPVRSLSRLNISKCEKGFVYIGGNVIFRANFFRYWIIINGNRGRLMQQNFHPIVSIALGGLHVESSWAKRSKH